MHSVCFFSPLTVMRSWLLVLFPRVSWTANKHASSW